jgi:hypothetical protein
MMCGKMASSELRGSWAITVRHLAASRYYLSEVLGSSSATSLEREFVGFLRHNELDLALGCAEELGMLSDAPREFWIELRMAAESMGLKAEASRYEQLSGGERSPGRS